MMKKTKKVCNKCGRIFIDTENKKICPVCSNKKHKIIGVAAIGSGTLGIFVNKHKKDIGEAIKTILRLFKR